MPVGCALRAAGAPVRAALPACARWGADSGATLAGRGRVGILGAALRAHHGQGRLRRDEPCAGAPPPRCCVPRPLHMRAGAGPGVPLASPGCLSMCAYGGPAAPAADCEPGAPCPQRLGSPGPGRLAARQGCIRSVYTPYPVAHSPPARAGHPPGGHPEAAPGVPGRRAALAACAGRALHGDRPRPALHVRPGQARVGAAARRAAGVLDAAGAAWRGCGSLPARRRAALLRGAGALARGAVACGGAGRCSASARAPARMSIVSVCAHALAGSEAGRAVEHSRVVSRVGFLLAVVRYFIHLSRQ